MNECDPEIIVNLNNYLAADPALQQPADENLQNLIRQNALIALSKLCPLIMINDVEKRTQRAAAIFIHKILSPPPNEIRYLQIALGNPDNTTELKKIVTALLRGLLFDDEIVRKNCGLAIVKVLLALPDLLPELNSTIYELATAADKSHFAHSGGLYTISNLLQTKIPLEKVRSFCSHLFPICLSYLLSKEVPDFVKLDSIECISSIIQKDHIVTNNEQFLHILTIFEQLLQVQDTSLIIKIIQSIYKVIIDVYPQEEIDINIKLNFIFDIIVTKKMDTSNIDIKIKIIQFWSDLSKYEYYNKNESFYRRLIQLKMNELITIFVNQSIKIICNDDEDEIYFMEQLEFCLVNFMLLNESIINSLINTVISLITEPDPLKQRISLYILRSIIKYYRKNIKSVNDSIYNFLSSSSTALLELLKKPLSISCACLTCDTISSMIRKTGIFIRNSEEFNTLFSIIHNIFSSDNIPYSLFDSASSILISVCKRCDKNNESILSFFFDPIYSLSINLLQSTDSSFKFQNNGAEILSCLISSSPPSTIPKFEPIFTSAVNLIQSGFNISQGNIRFSILHNMSSILTAFCNRMMTGIRPHLPTLIPISLNLLDDPLLVEDSPIFASSLIMCCVDDVHSYAINMMPCLLRIISLRSNTAVNAAVSTIGDLFRSTHSQLSTYQDGVFEMLGPMITQGLYERDVVFKIVRCLADVTKALRMDLKSQHKALFFEALKGHLNEISLSDPKEADCDFFETYLYAFGAIASASDEDILFIQNNKNQYVNLLLNYIKAPIKKKEIDILTACQFIQDVGNSFKNHINILLNHRRIRSFLMEMRKTDSELVNLKAKEVLKFLGEFH